LYKSIVLSLQKYTCVTFDAFLLTKGINFANKKGNERQFKHFYVRHCRHYRLAFSSWFYWVDYKAFEEER